MGQTWGEQHRTRQAKRGTPTKWTARSAKNSKSGTFKTCKQCSGSGRVSKMFARGKCLTCDGTGKIYL